MTGLLENKVVIIAGLGGIGNGLAQRYADEGALLVIGDLDAELTSRVADEVDPSGDRVRGMAFDGADEDSVARHRQARSGAVSAGSTACT